VSREALVGGGFAVSQTQLLAVIVLVVVYGLIVSDKLHRTLAALLGAVAVIGLGLLDQHEAFSPHIVDFNVIFLLAGMMIIASILGRTGIFRWLAVEAVRRAVGRPYRLLVLISVVVALASAFLDNVTAVVLMTPVTFFIAQRLGVEPMPYLVSLIIASNIGGTATLIGDPPNIIIGSRLNKDFNDFLLHAAPAAVVCLIVYLGFARWLFRKQLARAETSLGPDDIARLVREERRIEDPHLMRLGLFVLGLTVIGFLVARPLGLEGATIALAGAVLLMMLARENVSEVLKTVEWSTLLFFIGLFIVVGAVVESGIISELAKLLLSATGGRPDVTAIAILWMSAILSAIVDNIPYAITMAPLVHELGSSMNIEPLIWALVLGADIGGNATIVGASANVVVSSMSDARGYKITFLGYLRYGLPATAVTMAVCTADLFVRYDLFR
jgi:Na+/H+ antiporter NhaD/arsenite permease-like protein